MKPYRRLFALVKPTSKNIGKLFYLYVLRLTVLPFKDNEVLIIVSSKPEC
jgi:hypothetical protein